MRVLLVQDIAVAKKCSTVQGVLLGPPSTAAPIEEMQMLLATACGEKCKKSDDEPVGSTHLQYVKCNVSVFK